MYGISKCFDEYRAHLHILATKPMLGHVEGVTPSTHNSSIQIRLKLDTVKRVQIETTLPGQAARSLDRQQGPAECQQGRAATRALGSLQGARYIGLESLRNTKNIMIGRQQTYIRNNAYIYMRYVRCSYDIYHIYL